MKRRHTESGSYLNSAAIILVGSLVLFTFSLLPKSATGFAAAGDKPAECNEYFGDKICDDSPADCGPAYVSGESLDICDECQAIKDGKPAYDCAAAKSAPATGPESALCKGYFDDKVCDDKKEKCGNFYIPGQSTDHCEECSTGGYPCYFNAVQPSGGSATPNLYVSYSEFAPKYTNGKYVTKKTGVYGAKKQWARCSGPLPMIAPCKVDFYYEIDSDGSIVKNSMGKDQLIYSFELIIDISKTGNTYEKFKIQLQKLKPKSDGWQTVYSSSLVLLDTSLTVVIPLHIPTAGSFVDELKDDVDTGKLRLVIDSENKIAESNENDNEYLIDLPIKRI